MSMADRDGLIWFDGEMVPWRDAKVHVLTHTLHYGMGVFEGVRAYETDKGPAIFKLREHTDRLFRSAHIMRMPMPFDKDTINEAQKAVVKANNLHEAYLRPMVFYGSEGMGLRADNLQAHVIVAAWSWPSYMSPEAKANGHYINSMLALREALDSGCEEALLLDNEGYVAEGSGENIFIIRDGIMYTPELTSCLDGITRKTIFSFAEELGVEIREKRITRDEVYIADEAFFTGTAAEVLPIRELDGRAIGTGVRGALTEKFQTMYFDTVKGRRPENKEWLSLI